MMKRLAEEKNIHIVKRLTAILVAVVFVFGMMYMPAGIYAAEPEAAGDTIEATDPTTETVATEAIDNKESVTEEETTEEPSLAETEAIEAAEAESPADETTVEDLTDLVIVTDGNGNDIDLEDLDENAYDGFIYKLKDDTKHKRTPQIRI